MQGHIYYLLAINTASWAIFAWDKRQSRRAGWRVSEKTLLLLAILGGSAGEWLAMYMFRHKTRRRLFAWGLPIIILLQASVGICLLER